MLTGPKLNLFTDLIGQCSKEELIWMNGYLSARLTEPHPAPLHTSSQKKITIAYGTETGNSKKLATDFAARAKKKGLAPKLVSLDQYRLTDLPKEEYFITVISTQGEGEPPLAAKKFYEHIHYNGFVVPQLKYGVLALGDTSYPLFCKTGEDVDAQLQKLGGNRIAPLQKCDLDYEEAAQDWFSQFLETLQLSQSAVVTAAPVLLPETKKTTTKKIYTRTVLSATNLNARGSSYQTDHIEIAAEGVEYLPGDSIGIVPYNDPNQVAEILLLTGTDGKETIEWKTETLTIAELLLKKINTSYLLDKAIKQYGSLLQQEIPSQRTDLCSLLRKFPLTSTLFKLLLKDLTAIAPRIYNIASSPTAHDGEVHITVLAEVFSSNEITHKGLCTRFLESKQPGDAIEFFIQTNKRFRLPAPDQDIIMIGPGTGIAPFRSFVSERDVTGAAGRNWLFFGAEQFTTDFLYQTEWQDWFHTNVLTKVSVAFSKDHEKPFTTADKIIQQAAGIFEWLQSGAYLYLCGEKEPMGKEVEKALLQVIQTQGMLTEAEASAYWEQLKQNGRYMKDLY